MITTTVSIIITVAFLIGVYVLVSRLFGPLLGHADNDNSLMREHLELTTKPWNAHVPGNIYHQSDN